MAAVTDRKACQALSDLDLGMHGSAVAESDFRSNPYSQQLQFHYSGPLDYSFADVSPSYYHRRETSHVQNHPSSSAHLTTSNEDIYTAQSNELPANMTSGGNLKPNDYQDAFSTGIWDPALTSIIEDEDFAAAMASFQPCDDCTPATKTTIPHHHHKPGRLPGASATMDGHFCCSWLVHGQPCFLCFESAEALDNHIKNDHAGKDGTYRCLWQDCSKHDNSTNTSESINFGNKPKLMRHVHSHTGYKPFPCPYPGCDKGFVTKEQLKNHETTHTKSRKYKCDQCGKSFAVKSALTTHITAVHDEKKIHRCDLCGKSFADSSNLSKHKQTHYRSSGISKHRSRAGASSSTNAGSTPSTPSTEPATPHLLPCMQKSSPSAVPFGLMAPPAIPKLAGPGSCCALLPATCSIAPMTSTKSASSLQPSDPNCYCCDQRCSPPAGPATPCEEAEDCDLDGFCDLPDCTATPCNVPEECDLDGFCNLPDCLAHDGESIVSPSHSMSSAYHCHEPALGYHRMGHPCAFQQSHWDDMLEHGFHHQFTQREIEEQFTHMHAS